MNKFILSIDLLEEICKNLDSNSIRCLFETNKELYKIGKKVLFLRNAYIKNISTLNRLQFHLETSYLKRIQVKSIKDVNLHIPVLPEYTRIENCTVNPFYNEVPKMLSTELKELYIDCFDSHIHLKFENMPNIRKIHINCSTLEYCKNASKKCKLLGKVDMRVLHIKEVAEVVEVVEVESSSKVEEYRNAYKYNKYNKKYIDT